MRELRHLLATLVYRAGRSLDDAPAAYARTSIGGDARTPLEILSHMSTVLAWATSHLRGTPDWSPQTAGTWDETLAAWQRATRALDDALRTAPPNAQLADQLRQGPLADCLTHTGQLALLRRVAGKPVPPENYMQAAIAVSEPEA